VQRLEAACQGKSEGAQCSFTRANGNNANGSCMSHLIHSQTVLLCVPPQMMKRMNGGAGSSN